MWDVAQYTRYADERARPFTDLLARVPVADARRVVDLGCGPGTLSASLAQRWPGARVTGVDSSAEMVAAAASVASDQVEVVEADVRDWAPDGPVDVVISNAALQWVPDHAALLSRFAGWLAPGGALAFQVPGNFGAPSHVLLRELRTSPRWADPVGEGADRGAASLDPADYLDALAGAGLVPDVWETTYLHLLSGPDPVLEWTKGTALRPVLARLDAGEQAEFLAEYAARLRVAYPPGPRGTVFPFRRIFAVGRRCSTSC